MTLNYPQRKLILTVNGKIRYNYLWADERLTPRFARRVLRAYGQNTGEVYDPTMGIKYRVYERSARKVMVEPDPQYWVKEHPGEAPSEGQEGE